MREARNVECNASVKAAGGISEEIANLGKDIKRDQDEAGTHGDTFESTEAVVFMQASNLYEVR